MKHDRGTPLSDPDAHEEVAFAVWMPVKAALSVPGVGEVVKNLMPKLTEIWQQNRRTEDRLPGGKGDQLSYLDVDPFELAMGIEVEKEHTKDAGLALEIALDHLAEDPHYYTKLKKVHSESSGQCAKRSVNKPWRTPGGTKKFAVCGKDGSQTKLVRFGDPNLEIKRDDPARRKNFRARHGCDAPGSKTKAKYWACKTWERGKRVSDVVEGDQSLFSRVAGRTPNE
jgi:hypothetical protein